MELSPEDPVAFRSRGLALVMLTRYQEAMRGFELGNFDVQQKDERQKRLSHKKDGTDVSGFESLEEGPLFTFRNVGKYDYI